MATQGISGVGLAMATGGALLAYAGFTGKNPLEALKDVTSGAPTGVRRTSAGLSVGKGDSTTTSTSYKTSGSGSGSSLVAAAKKYIGTPYVWGGVSSKGMDCSGLVVLAFQDAYGVTPPRTTYGQEPWKELVTVKGDKLPGDLIFWPGHVAIYVGGGNVIHAPRPGRSVTIAPLKEAGPALTPVSSVKRYIGTGSTSSAESQQSKPFDGSGNTSGHTAEV